MAGRGRGAADSREREGEDMHQMLVRLPIPQAEILRKAAYDEERPKVAIIRDALDEYFARHGHTAA